MPTIRCHLGRTQEVVEAFAARQGPITLQPEQVARMLANLLISSLQVHNVEQSLGGACEASSRATMHRLGQVMQALGMTERDAAVVMARYVEDMTQ